MKVLCFLTDPSTFEMILNFTVLSPLSDHESKKNICKGPVQLHLALKINELSKMLLQINLVEYVLHTETTGSHCSHPSELLSHRLNGLQKFINLQSVLKFIIHYFEKLDSYKCCK